MSSVMNSLGCSICQFTQMPHHLRADHGHFYIHGYGRGMPFNLMLFPQALLPLRKTYTYLVRIGLGANWGAKHSGAAYIHIHPLTVCQTRRFV